MSLGKIQGGFDDILGPCGTQVIRLNALSSSASPDAASDRDAEDDADETNRGFKALSVLDQFRGEVMLLLAHIDDDVMAGRKPVSPSSWSQLLESPDLTAIRRRYEAHPEIGSAGFSAVMEQLQKTNLSSCTRWTAFVRSALNAIASGKEIEM